MSDLKASDFIAWAKAEIENARDAIERYGSTADVCQFERGRIKALRDLIRFAEPETIPPIESPAHYGLTVGPDRYA